jgi:hypothetical protein
MKKIIFSAILLTLIISSAHLLTTFAQEKNVAVGSEYKKEREDFLFQFNNYNNAHKDYVNSANAYQKFGTIASQQEAISKTKQVLASRSEALRTYLQLIKVILNSQIGLDVFLRNAQFGKLEATQAFLSTHKQNVDNAQSILEINSESSRLEREAPTIEELSYETLSVILVGKMQNLEYRANKLIEEIENSDNGKKDEQIEKGISEAKNKLRTVRTYIDEAIQIIQKYQEGNDPKSRVRKTKAISTYRDVKNEAKEAKPALMEVAVIIKEMKGKLGNE